MPTIHRSSLEPAGSTSFVGRAAQLEQVRAALRDARLVTLLGPGGVGKTRIAERVVGTLGRGPSGQVVVVRLGDVHGSDRVVGAVATALGLRDQGPGRLAAAVRTHLAPRDALLLLDSCEHVSDAVAELVADVLGGAPRVRVLATSREPLGIAGERRVPVPTLGVPAPGDDLARLRRRESVELFCDRAVAVAPAFALTSRNAAAVAEICRRLDGLPLAIELAAARVTALTPEQIRDRLGDRFRLLTGSSRGAPRRHQALRETIEWSVELLRPDERRLFQRLAVFAGGFTIDDVEAVCCDVAVPREQVLDRLQALLDKSLLVAAPSGDVVVYRLLESLRAFAAERLRQAGEHAQVEAQHEAYYADRAAAFGREGQARLAPWLAWSDAAMDDVRAVLRRRLDRGDRAAAADLAGSLVWFWVTRGTGEGARWLDAALADPRGDVLPVDSPWPLFVRGFLAVQQGDVPRATTVLADAVRAARASGSVDALGHALAMASIAARSAGRADEAARLLAEAADVAERSGLPGPSITVLQARALRALADGQPAHAESAAAEGLRLARAAGDDFSTVMMLMNRGLALLLSHDDVRAESVLVEALRAACDLDDRVAQCCLVGALAVCAARAGAPVRAARLVGARDGLAAEVGGRLDPALSDVVAHAEDALVATLGTARLTAERAHGRALDRDAVRALALGDRARVEGTAAAATRGSGHAAPRDGTTRPPADAVSRREYEVAVLVAAGLSNRDIGGRLFISERTVESHVRSMLTKLDFRSRAQVASWVASQPTVGQALAPGGAAREDEAWPS